VSIYDFETSHNYQYDNDKGKPLSAFEYANELDLEGDASILGFIRMICGETEKNLVFTQEEINDLAVEPNE
jgi:hypothetical protein